MAIKISGDTIIDDSRVIVNADKIGIGTTNPHVSLEISNGDVGIGTTNPSAPVLNTNTSKLAVGIVSANTFFGNLVGGFTDTGDVTINNSLTVNGNTTLGNESSDTLTVNATPTFKEDATFEKDVQIDGVLTYEDVTNIDSVGLITARNGIHVLGVGVSVAGFSTFFNTVEFQDKVGIGTDNPGQKLDVVGGNIRVGKTSNGQFIGENNSGEEKIKLDTSGVSFINGGQLVVGGTTAQASDAVTLMPDGEVTAAGFYFSNNIGSPMNTDGFRRHTTGTICVDTASEERLRITSDGRVGIGTADITSKLTIASDNNDNPIETIRYNEGVDGATLFLQHSRSNDIGTKVQLNDNDEVGNIEFRSFASDNSTIVRAARIFAEADGTADATDVPAALVFSTNDKSGAGTAEERLRITGIGSVGVGLSNPSAKFHVNGTQNGLQARFGGTGTGLGISCFQKTNNNAGVIIEAQDATHGTLTFKTAGDERLRITSDGDIRVGSFTIVDTRNTGGIHIQPNKGISFRAFGSQSASRNWRIRNDDTVFGNLDFSVGDDNSTDIGSGAADAVLSLTKNHYVGINETNPIHPLSIGINTATAWDSTKNISNTTNNDFIGLNIDNQNSGSNPEVGIMLQAGSSGSGQYTINCRKSAGNSADLIFRTRDGGSASKEVLRITSNGDVGIGTTNPSASVGSGNTAVLAVGIVTANKFFGDLVGGITDTGDVTINGDLTISSASPKISLVDTGNNPDYDILNTDGIFKITSSDGSGTDKIIINTDGHVDITANLDCEDGLDVTGQVSVTKSVNDTDFTDDNLPGSTSGLYVANSQQANGVWSALTAMAYNDITNNQSASFIVKSVDGSTTTPEVYITQRNVNSQRTAIKISNDGSIDLNFAGSTKLSTTNEGVLVSGGTTTGTLNVTGVSTFADDINANGNLIGDDSTNISGINSVTATDYYGTFKGTIDSGVTISTDKIAIGTAKAQVVDNNDGEGHFFVETEGTERFRIDNKGQISSRGSTTAFDGTGDLNALQLYYDTSNGRASIGPYSSGGSTHLSFYTNDSGESGGNAATEKLCIDKDGNVGIGSTIPSQLLDIGGNTTVASNGRVNIYRSTSGSTNTAFQINSNVGGTNTTQFVIQAGGAVGIGSATPRANFKLDVNGDLSLGESGGTDNTYIEQKQNGDLHIINSGRDSDGSAVNHTGGAGGIGINRYNTIAGDTTYFRDFTVYDGKGTKVLVVDGSEGAVGIGTDNPSASVGVGNTGVLAVGIVTANEYFGTFKGTIDSEVTIATDKIEKDNTKAQVVDDGSNGHFLVETEGTERFRIGVDGRITNTGIDTSFVTTTFSGKYAKLDIRGTNIGDTNHYLISYGEGHPNDHQFHMVNFAGDTVFRTGSSGTEKLRITSDGKLLLTTAANAASAPAGGDNLVIKDSDGSGITILSGDANSGNIYMGSVSDNDVVRLESFYNSGSPYFNVYTGGGERLRAKSDGVKITGNLEVTGDLTYEDVTNIDSVGVITARSGIHVTSGGIDVDAGGINVDAGIATFPSVKVDGSGVPEIESTTKLHLKTAANNNVVIGSQTSDFNNQDEVDSGNTTVLNVGIVTANEYFGTFKGTIDAGSITDKIQQDNTKAQVVDNGSDGHFLVETEGTERFRIDKDGKIFIHGLNANGGNNASSLLTFGKRLNIHGTNSDEGISVVRYSASYGAYGLNIGRSRSDTFGNNTKVVDGDELGHVSFWGSNGSSFLRAAQITGECDDAVSGTSDMPGALSFRTTPDGASSPVEKMRITSEGYVQVKTYGSATTGGAPLYVGVTGKSSITYAGGADDTACVRIEDEGGSDNYYHGLELRTRQNGDVRLYAHDRGSNLADFVVATDKPGTIAEKFRITSDGKVGIGSTGVTSPTAYLHVKRDGGGASGTDKFLRIESTSSGSFGPNLIMQHSSASPADNDVISVINFNGLDDAGHETTYASIDVKATDVSDASPKGDLIFGTRSGEFDERLRITSGGDVGIGTDNPTGANAVNGNTATLAVGTLKANTITGNITGASSFTVEDKTSQYTILSSDVGKFITQNTATERFRINASTNFTAGQSVTLHNKSSGNVPIRREGTGVTLRFSGSALEGNRELTQRGIATIICIATDEYIISGSGLI